MLEIIANAKVNLFLEITGKLSDGYHTVDTIMQSVSLSDTIKIELLTKSQGINIICSVPDIPTDQRNIAYKTANAYLNAIDADCGVRIEIDKRIPSQAGMGGGSADGAAVLVGLNRLCGDLLTVEEMKSIASGYGADIPFCIDGGTQRLVGIGTESIEHFRFPDLFMVIIKPPVGISTPDAYKCLDAIHNDFVCHTPVNPELLIRSLRSREYSSDDLFMYNRFEETLNSLCAESLEIISYLTDLGCKPLLSGSGTAVFGIAESNIHAEKAVKSLEKRFSDCFICVCKTAESGCIL